ncbi:hypothetical protein GOBAR_DD36649 [Gossypium barbadense]|nr:hypothetical protein GOBAR_DD36649 [Gossypium barbadense]
MDGVEPYSFNRHPQYPRSTRTRHEIYVLLEVWGNRFLQLGRRSLRGEDWVDIAEKVSDALKSMKNEAQCRRMIDGLKRKFKKEKSKAERMGLNSSKWVFFRKMEMLMGLGSSSFRQQESWLACGVDSGEFVFMNPQVYLDRSNGFDEMRDSPAEMLADSVQRFGKIYEKIESSKREHMKELEKMRMDFQKELEGVVNYSSLMVLSQYGYDQCVLGIVGLNRVEASV